MARKKLLAIGATVGTVLMCMSIAAPAHADPVAGKYAIVGSDTLEDVVNALVNGVDYTGTSVRTITSKSNTVASFDATGSSYIISKTNGVRFGRPNGSSAGVLALSRSIGGTKEDGTTANSTTYVNGITANVSGQIDLARSSSSPTENANGKLAYVPFGRDAIAYAYTDNSTAAGIDSLTADQLKDIFSCITRTIDGKTVTPVIPQSGSGTRKDFLKKIGVDTGGNGNLASDSSCVVVGQEHDGNSLNVGGVSSGAAIANAIMPMSATRWIAMKNTTADGMSYSFDKSSHAVIAGVATTAGTVRAAVDSASGVLSPNTAYYGDSTWGRDTYLVVERARITLADGKYDSELAALLDPTIGNSLTNSQTLSAKAGAVKKKFGFLAPSSTTIKYANLSS